MATNFRFYQNLLISVMAASVSFANAAPPKGKGPMSFADLDQNKDGVVTKEEFDAAHAKRPGRKNHPDFEFFDTDNNGKVIPPELIAGQQLHHARKMKKGDMKRKRPEFVAIDSNNNGVVSLEEFTGFYKKRIESMPGKKFKKHASDIPDRFAAMDSNGDGGLTKPEYDAHPGRPMN